MNIPATIIYLAFVLYLAWAPRIQFGNYEKGFYSLMVRRSK